MLKHLRMILLGHFGIMTIVLRDIMGKELKKVKTLVSKGENIKTLDLLTFSNKGLIFISIESMDGVLTTSFIRE